jgi:hypothetical protein
MAKEEKGKEKGGEGEKGKRPKKHLHQIRSVQAEDGSIVHHHTYKAKKEDHHTEPERENVATSATPEEAGEHVAEQMGMNGQGGGEEEAAGGGEPEPAPAAAGAMPGA